MANPFAITTTATAVPLDTGRQGRLSFTVSNTSGRPIRGRARLVPANPAAASWLSLQGDAERDFPAAGTQQYTVQILVPPTGPAGSYPFRLDVVGVDNPDEELTQGPSVTFTVPEPAPPPKPFPWWIVVVAAVLLLAVIGGAVFFLTQNKTQALTAPTQLAPPNGSTFSIFPRTTHLTWAPVSGVVSYVVEKDCLGCCASSQWCADLGRPWSIVRGLTTPEYTFDFVGAQPGRWRVWAVDNANLEGPKSGWWTFTYTR